MRFILVKKLVAEGGALFIEGDGIMGGLELVEGLEQHLGEAVNGADHFSGLAYGESHRRPACLEGVVGAVDDGVAVKQNQKWLLHN